MAGIMEKSLNQRRFVWTIDAADKIIHVNDDWLAFARENSAPRLAAGLVLGQSLWRFIQGQETVYLYQQILAKLRIGRRPITFPFRCDAPDCRRFLEMKLSLLAGSAVRFQTSILRQEFRRPLDFLGTSRDWAGEFLKVCSWCNKIYIPDRGWGEPEDAIGALDLFGSRSMPRMTHTICDSCFDFIRQELIREQGRGGSATDRHHPA
jgi:hypothetical protein